MKHNKDYEKALQLPPKEFGEWLARRHLAMIERAVKRWAKKNPTETVREIRHRHGLP
jgi:hypothetical protein